MIDLYATTNFDSSRNKRPGVSGQHRKEFHCGDAFLMVSGDEPVDSMFFNKPGLTLVCRAHLLSPIEGPVATHLAGLYLQQGDKFVCGLRGTFAVIIYDHNLRALKAWTDHFGVERLVFTDAGNILSIATDIRILEAFSRRPSVIDPVAIQEYLQYTCIPTPRTIYKDISKLPPGHQLIANPRPIVHAYWDMNFDERRDPPRSERAWANETLQAVRSAVALNLNDLQGSDALGCFLSGGTDSSSIAGLVGQITGQAPRTFSIGFDDPRYNEIHYARIAAKRFGADHHEYFVTPDDILTLLQKLPTVYDEPFGNSSVVPTYYCARLAAENGVTDLLAGDGGDELFGGNSRYVDDRVFQHYTQIPSWLRRRIVEPAVLFGSSRSSFRQLQQAARYIRRSNVQVPDRYFSYSLISSVPGRDLFTADFLAATNGHDPLTTARDHFGRVRAESDLNRWLYLDLKIVITDCDLRKVTTMSRFAGINPRYPLLDPGLAEFTGCIPPNLKVRHSQLRYIFKKAMQEVLPNEIITKSKHGFGLPYGVWLGENRSLHDFTFDILGSARSRQRGYFREGLLEWLWSKYESGHRGFYGEILWMLLMLELWHVARSDNHLTKAVEVTPAATSVN